MCFFEEFLWSNCIFNILPAFRSLNHFAAAELEKKQNLEIPLEFKSSFTELPLVLTSLIKNSRLMNEMSPFFFLFKIIDPERSPYSLTSSIYNIVRANEHIRRCFEKHGDVQIMPSKERAGSANQFCVCTFFTVPGKLQREFQQVHWRKCLVKACRVLAHSPLCSTHISYHAY